MWGTHGVCTEQRLATSSGCFAYEQLTVSIDEKSGRRYLKAVCKRDAEVVFRGQGGIGWSVGLHQSWEEEREEQEEKFEGLHCGLRGMLIAIG
jgi:hypothetical protein